MLNKVLETSRFVVDNAKHVKINYDKNDNRVMLIGSAEKVFTRKDRYIKRGRNISSTS